MARTSSLAALSLVVCLSQPALADKPAVSPPATPEQVHHTVDLAVGYLQKESASWLKTRKCAACHHAAMPLWSLFEADRQGYTVDKKFLAETIESTLGSMDKMISAKLVSGPKDPPDTRPMGRALNMGLPFMAVAARQSPSLTEGQKQSLKWIADKTLEKQMKDGSWEFFLSRPPINETQLTDAIWIIMALQGETNANSPPAQRAALTKANVWLSGSKLPDTYQSKVLKLLLKVRAGKPQIDLQPAIDEILASQQADGGWRQLPDLQSDAFATGQTLYVLALAGYTAKRPEIKRAVNFLVATQKPDGSWPMKSRSTPDGRPGSSKLLTPINCGAASWAALGLAGLEPKR